MTSKAKQPNIIVILSDDQGPWAMGCAGNAEIRTPNLDRLAATGVRFENFFCASPVCSPARASLLTGRMPSQHGVHDWIRKGNMAGEEQVPIEYLAGMTGYTDILARNGYVCALSGKWHLGDSVRPQKGFTHWFAHQTGGSAYYGAPMVRKGQPYREERYVTDVITDDALDFIDGRKGEQAPFYLSLHYTAPHSPWIDAHPKELLDSYDDCPFESCPEAPCNPWQINSAPRGTGKRRREILKGYFAAVTAMDANIGRVLDRLEALGMRENTLIFFTSDNGMNMGHHGIFGKGNGTFPPNMFDSSVKVPTIVSHPAVVARGEVDTGLHSHYDFMPTLLDYVGLENPEADRLPGRSFAPLLNGERSHAQRTIAVCDEYGPTRMIRDERCKYVRRYAYGPDELYNLVEDPEENHNLIGEPGNEDLLQHMKARMDKFFTHYTDTAVDGTHERVYGTGQLDLAGSAGHGREAFFPEFSYTDEEGRPRPEGYRPPDL